MLIQFSFKNYGPFREEAVFDMRAVKAYKEHSDHLIQVSGTDPLLRVAAIYGANASGKSNFIKAYACYIRIVLNSFQKNNKDEGPSVLESEHDPFLLTPHANDSEIEFEGIYYWEGREYRYGFTFNKSQIKTEWLYTRSKPTARESMILDREDKITLGSSVIRTCAKYKDSIDTDVLALSFFSGLKLKNPVFRDTVLAISDILPLRTETNLASRYFLDRYFSTDFDGQEKTRLMRFLNGIDVGIHDIRVEKNPSNDQVSVHTVHIGKDGQRFEFPMEIESDGTRRAIVLYSFVRLAVMHGRGLMIDEFNNQLHPLLQKYIIDMFFEEGVTGQLIYTTHDTTLLDKRYVRRDEIWFVSKDEAGESTMYSLAEFKLRNDKTFEKDYLGGAFGGIPILREQSLTEE